MDLLTFIRAFSTVINKPFSVSIDNFDFYESVSFDAFDIPSTVPANALILDQWAVHALDGGSVKLFIYHYHIDKSLVSGFSFEGFSICDILPEWHIKKLIENKSILPKDYLNLDKYFDIIDNSSVDNV